MRSKHMGKPVYQELELLEGREVGGKRPSWLITLRGYNSVEKASDLVGSTLLVSERPTLNDDEYYIPDPVGMAVILQRTGEEVPVVDQQRRLVEIDPPAGLLELKSPPTNESKRQKAKLKKDGKEKRKLPERLSGLKKKMLDYWADAHSGGTVDWDRISAAGLGRKEMSSLQSHLPTFLGGGTRLYVKGAIDLGLAGRKSLFQLQAERLLIVQELSRMVTNVTTKPCIPWIVMTIDATDTSTRAYFEDNEFWGLDRSQVALLEVVGEEEFAPVKNAPAAGVSDTVDTARCSVKSLTKRLPPLTASKTAICILASPSIYKSNIRVGHVVCRVEVRGRILCCPSRCAKSCLLKAASVMATGQQVGAETEE
ncbi:hypothetical protein R1sor_012412 [Riccia sorocarpa]|uniref:Uncharacterized protein n=1 Tax=Riccia sorocarpa TaxID=122646 RepID=A0ABD3I7U2_9MARC